MTCRGVLVAGCSLAIFWQIFVILVIIIIIVIIIVIFFNIIISSIIIKLLHNPCLTFVELHLFHLDIETKRCDMEQTILT